MRYQPRRRDEGVLFGRLRELAQHGPRFGYRRLYALLRREEEIVNHRRIYRLYSAAELAVLKRRRKRVVTKRGQQVRIETIPNEHWCLDFMSDTMSMGRRLRTLSAIIGVHGKTSRLRSTPRSRAGL